MAAIKDVNLFLNPHKMPEETLRYLTGLPVEEAWKLTDELVAQGIGERVKSLSLSFNFSCLLLNT